MALKVDTPCRVADDIVFSADLPNGVDVPLLILPWRANCVVYASHNAPIGSALQGALFKIYAVSVAGRRVEVGRGRADSPLPVNAAAQVVARARACACDHYEITYSYGSYAAYVQQATAQVTISAEAWGWDGMNVDPVTAHYNGLVAAGFPFPGNDIVTRGETDVYEVNAFNPGAADAWLQLYDRLPEQGLGGGSNFFRLYVPSAGNASVNFAKPYRCKFGFMWTANATAGDYAANALTLQVDATVG